MIVATEDYPGTQPWTFTGGTIRRVAVDISGEPSIFGPREGGLQTRRPGV